MNTKGLITIPAETPKPKSRWYYEFHSGELTHKNGIRYCSIFEYEGSAGVSEPWVVITNVFCV